MERSWMSKTVPLWFVLMAVLATAATVFAVTVVLPQPDIVRETIKLFKPIKYEITLDVVKLEGGLTTIDLIPWDFKDCTKDGVSYKCPIITVKINLVSVPDGKPPIKVRVELLQQFRGSVAWGEVKLGPNDYQAGENTVRLAMEFDNPNKSWEEIIYDWTKYIVVTIEPA